MHRMGNCLTHHPPKIRSEKRYFWLAGWKLDHAAVDWPFLKWCATTRKSYAKSASSSYLMMDLLTTRCWRHFWPDFGRVMDCGECLQRISVLCVFRRIRVIAWLDSVFAANFAVAPFDSQFAATLIL